MLAPLISSIGRWYPFYSGNYQLVNSRIGRKIARSTKEVVWCPSPGGQLLVPLDDDVGRCIYFTGDYDKKLTWLCRKLARPGDAVFDIGEPWTNHPHAVEVCRPYRKGIFVRAQSNFALTSRSQSPKKLHPEYSPFSIRTRIICGRGRPFGATWKCWSRVSGISIDLT